MKDYIKVLLAVLAVTLIRAQLGLHHFNAGIDDSNIYFVYVRNIFEGQGFVYNPGGPRVEGFTSLLWTLILTAIYSIRFLPFETTVLALCFLITTTTVFLYFRFFKSLFDELGAWLLVLFILFIPGFIDWSVFTLMDTCLWIMATSAATILLLNGKHQRLFFFITILLPFIRPEGLFVAPALCFLKIGKEWAHRIPLARAIRNNILPVVLVFAGIALLTLFRKTYFGWPLPNTYYAKVSQSLIDNIKAGIFYFYDSVRHTSIIPSVLLLISIITVIKRSLTNWRTQINYILLSLIILMFIGYPFLTGGDHFKYSRFFQPAFPMIGLLFFSLFYKKINIRKPATAFSLLIILLLLNINSTDITSFRGNWKSAVKGYLIGARLDLVNRSQLQSEFDIAVYGKNLAAHMNDVLSVSNNQPSYGVVAAGGTGYVYKGRIVDLMGLNNPEMAHANKVKNQGVKNHGSFSKPVFYRQDVDIFLTWPDPLTKTLQQTDSSALNFLQQLRDPAYFINRVCANIFNDEEFRRLYRYVRIDGAGKHFYGFVRYPAFAQKYPALKVTPLD